MIRIGTPDDLGEILGMLRTLAGLTQFQVATAIDTHALRVGKWERGVRTPHAGSLIRLLEAMGYQLAIVPTADGSPAAQATRTEAYRLAERKLTGAGKANVCWWLSHCQRPDLLQGAIALLDGMPDAIVPLDTRKDSDA
jgi:transcriptional regulator with XRE-family HTH domain